MKTIAYAAAGLLTSFLALSPAFAQSQGNQGKGPSPGSYDAGYQDGMRTAREKYASEIIERIRDSGQNQEDEDGNGSESGAHFRLIRGNTRLDVRCSPEDATEKCVEAAIALMDHVGIERREAKAGTQPPGSGNPPPPATPQRE